MKKNKNITSVIYSFYLLIYKICPFKKVFIKIIKLLNLHKNEKIISDLYFKGFFTVKLNDIKFKLYSKKDDKSAFEILLNGLSNSWDACSINLWHEISKHSKVILDIGTNIGLYALSAYATNNKAKVIGFEPSNNSYEKIRQNIEINKFKITLEKLALSNFNGDALFYDNNTHTAISSLIKNSNIKNTSDLISYTVNVDTLDNYTKNNQLKQIDLISIDVEENEVNVLNGMLNVLTNHKPTLIIEILNEEIGYEIQNILDSHNYQYYFIDEKRKKIIPVQKIKHPIDLSEHSNNLLAIQQDKFNKYKLNKFLI